MASARQFCAERQRILEEFIDATYRCRRLQSVLTQERRWGRDTAELHARITEARHRRDRVKRTLLSHQELHGC